MERALSLPETGASEVLRHAVAGGTTLPLEAIADPMEAIANLLYLLEQEANDSERVRLYGRLLAKELVRMVDAAQMCLLSALSGEDCDELRRLGTLATASLAAKSSS